MQHRPMRDEEVAHNQMALRRGKIVDGRVQKIFKERALLEQPFIKDTSKTVAEHIKAQVATIGENIQVCMSVCKPVQLVGMPDVSQGSPEQ